MPCADRFQSDVAHAYQRLRTGGLPPSRIISLSFDDVPTLPSNPYPGALFNRATGQEPGVDVNRNFSKTVSSDASLLGCLIAWMDRHCVTSLDRLPLGRFAACTWPICAVSFHRRVPTRCEQVTGSGVTREAFLQALTCSGQPSQPCAASASAVSRATVWCGRLRCVF